MSSDFIHKPFPFLKILSHSLSHVLWKWKNVINDFWVLPARAGFSDLTEVPCRFTELFRLGQTVSISCSEPRNEVNVQNVPGCVGKCRKSNNFCCLCGSYNILTRTKLTMSKYQFLTELYKFSRVQFSKCTVWRTPPQSNPPQLPKVKTNPIPASNAHYNCRSEPTAPSKLTCN